MIAEVFAQERALSDVAANWATAFENHQSDALADLFNFILKSAGCDHKVDAHVVEDPDHFPDKLTDIQDEYQAQNITEYPLIAKGRNANAFKQSLSGFFNAFIKTIASSHVLFNEPVLIENIVSWVGTMSSAANRPFRHTATVVSLAIISTLCEVGKELVESSAKMLQLSEKEQKNKRNMNKARVAEMKATIKQAGQRQEQLDTIIKDWFDTVFVHRYRDVDPRIRVDCVQALSDWIATYPDHFFDGTYLRYLGWVLADTSAATRLEVVKQLQRLFRDKDKLGGLKTFTERFRARMVEMATRDNDHHVRASAIELLDTLRESGLLEPDDVDSVGRLIFDSEARVRKAVVGFFAENINELYESKIEEMGGQEAVDEGLPSVDEDGDYDSPRLEWVKLKCLVEVFQSYDSHDNEAAPSQAAGNAEYSLIAPGAETRFTLAAQALYDHIDELRKWEIIAGYLLFDHSAGEQNGVTDDIEAQLKQECQLDETDEIILLDILNASAKARLIETMEASSERKAKKTKKEKQDLMDDQETAVRYLATVIPKLLTKFGASPETAAAVLRLEHLLEPETFQEVSQDSATFAALLDDINKQFMSHGSEKVLVEARAALRNALLAEDVGEVTGTKVQALWENLMNALQTLCSGRNLTIRGNLSENILNTISNTVLRIATLGPINDCTDALMTMPPASKKRKGRHSDIPKSGVDILLELVQRGRPGEHIGQETELAEDILVANASRSLLFYFMWKIKHWRSTIEGGMVLPDEELDVMASQRDNFVATLTRILKERHGVEDLRLQAAGVLLDLHVLFGTLREARPKRGVRPAEGMNDDYLALALEVEASTQQVLQHLLTATEKHFAKKARKTLDLAEDDDPIDSDDEEEEENEAEGIDEEKQHSILLAEQRLCELAGKIVLAILAGVIDEGSGASEEGEEHGLMRMLLEKNKTRLGPNYKGVVEYLDIESKEKAKAAKAKAKGKPGRPPGSGKVKSAEVVVDDEEEEEGDEGDDDEDEENLRRKGLAADEPEEEPEEEQQNEEVESVLGD